MEKQKKSINKQFRNIRWTLQQNQENKRISGEDLKKHLEGLNYIDYSIFQFEKGTETGNLHYQGFSQFSKPQWLTKLNKDFLSANVGRVDGTPQENIAYCTKKEKDGVETYIDGPWVIGEPKNQYKSRALNTDQKWKNIIEMAKNGKGYEEILDSHATFAVVHESKVKKIITKYQPFKNFDTKDIVWIYGSGGSGKTSTAYKMLRQFYSHDQILIQKATTKNSKKIWFNASHENKKALILEEIRVGHPDPYELLNLIDGDSQIETKGGMIDNPFEVIFFLGSKSPQDTYEPFSVLEDKKQLFRRIPKLFAVYKNDKQIENLKKEGLSKIDFRMKYQPFIVDKTYTLLEYIDKISEIIESQEREIVRLSEDHDKLVTEIKINREKIEHFEEIKVEEQLEDIKKVVVDWINNPKSIQNRDALLKNKVILDPINGDKWFNIPNFNLDWLFGKDKELNKS